MRIPVITLSIEKKKKIVKVFCKDMLIAACSNPMQVDYHINQLIGDLRKARKEAQEFFRDD